jgi:hypothetical protein
MERVKGIEPSFGSGVKWFEIGQANIFSIERNTFNTPLLILPKAQLLSWRHCFSRKNNCPTGFVMEILFVPSKLVTE